MSAKSTSKVKSATKKAPAKARSGARRETTRQRPVTNSRSAKIKMLVNAGMGNAAIWAAMEEEYPQIIEDAKRRHETSGDPKLEHDAKMRQAVGWDINSTRGLEIKADQKFMAMVAATGGLKITAKTLDQMDMINRRRFPSGNSKIDEIFGKTEFVHEEDHPDSKYATETKKIKTRDDKGAVIFKDKIIKTWISGTWRQGDPMIYVGEETWKQGDPLPTTGFERTRNEDGTIREDLDLTKQLVEVGMPEAFVTIMGGGPGGGKTKLATKLSRSIIGTTEEGILYVNGEAQEEDFRRWVADTDPHLFNVISRKMLPIQAIWDEAERIKPRLIVIDSVQTLLEWNKGAAGQQSVMHILNELKVNPKAGRPHIIIISQLNKANDLKGSRDLEHLADAVGYVLQIEDREDTSRFHIPVKNRAAPTPNGTLFVRKTNDIEFFEDSEAKRVAYSLEVPEDSALAEGIDDLPLSSDSVEGGDDDDAGTTDADAAE